MKTLMKRMGMIAAAVTIAAVGVVRGQTLSSGSTGVDGALTLTTPGTVIFDPAALGIDVDGDNVFNFTTITVASGATLTFNRNAFNTPVYLLATGDVVITGKIDVSGRNRSGNSPGTGGPGGFDADSALFKGSRRGTA